MLVRKASDLLCCLPYLNTAMQMCCGTPLIAAMPCTLMQPRHHADASS
jgi:hypothetical protein